MFAICWPSWPAPIRSRKRSNHRTGAGHDVDGVARARPSTAGDRNHAKLSVPARRDRADPQRLMWSAYAWRSEMARRRRYGKVLPCAAFVRLPGSREPVAADFSRPARQLPAYRPASRGFEPRSRAPRCERQAYRLFAINPSKPREKVYLVILIYQLAPVGARGRCEL